MKLLHQSEKIVRRWATRPATVYCYCLVLFETLVIPARWLTGVYTISVKTDLYYLYEGTPEISICNDEVLLALKPLYGISEIGLHWTGNYEKHHVKELGTRPTTADQCVLYRHSDGLMDGLTVLQVDAGFGFGTKLFLEDENRSSEKFLTNPQMMIEKRNQATFIGLEFTTYEMDPTTGIKKIVRKG